MPEAGVRIPKEPHQHHEAGCSVENVALYSFGPGLRPSFLNRLEVAPENFRERCDDLHRASARRPRVRVPARATQSPAGVVARVHSRGPSVASPPRPKSGTRISRESTVAHRGGEALRRRGSRLPQRRSPSGDQGSGYRHAAARSQSRSGPRIERSAMLPERARTCRHLPP